VVDDLFELLAGDEGGVVLRLHVQPGAGRTAVMGRHGDALKVKVGAPPEGGRANQAVLDLIASMLGVKAGDVELTSGASSRTKRVKVRGVEADDVRRVLEQQVADGNKPTGRGVRPPAR
jgi:uncharacterized protein (TIGR00251 family)